MHRWRIDESRLADLSRNSPRVCATKPVGSLDSMSLERVRD
ncbi:Uncharacterised protein [Vibrio cholerae]|nr:Uncharacterised protein [Vibrio cholerae]